MKQEELFQRRFQVIIQFNVDKTFLKELDIDNLGEFAIEASNEEGMF